MSFTLPPRKPGRPSFWHRRFQQRFVQTVEGFGYLLCLVVTAGLIYSLMVKVEVVADVEGTLEPRAAQVTVESEAAIADFLVKPGETVTTGQALCKIATAPEARRSVYVGRMLDRAAKTLAGDADARNKQALPSVVAAATMFLGGGELPVLTSPVAGLAVPQEDLLHEESIAAHTPLVLVYEPQVAVFKGVVKDTKKAPVATGQAVRMSLPVAKNPVAIEILTGTIESVTETEGGGADTVVTFSNFSAPAQDYLRTWVQDNATVATPKPLSARVQVVTGTQSLFKSLFGRK